MKYFNLVYSEMRKIDDSFNDSISTQSLHYPQSWIIYIKLDREIIARVGMPIKLLMEEALDGLFTR